MFVTHDYFVEMSWLVFASYVDFYAHMRLEASFNRKKWVVLYVFFIIVTSFHYMEYERYSYFFPKGYYLIYI